VRYRVGLGSPYTVIPLINAPGVYFSLVKKSKNSLITRWFVWAAGVYYSIALRAIVPCP